MSDKTEGNARECERFDIPAQIEFYVDADIIMANSLDISQSGLSFITDNAMEVDMRLNIDGNLEERRAKILWAKKEDDGKVRYGLEFVNEEDISENA